MPTDLKALYPQARMVKTGAVTVEVPGATKVDGETIPRRNAKVKDGLKNTPTDGVNTLYDVLTYAVKKFGNAKAVGSRKIVKTHVETKKVKKMIDGKQQEVDKEWTYFELSEYTYKSFVEFEKQVNAVGSAFSHLGFKPTDRLHLFAATRCVSPVKYLG